MNDEFDVGLLKLLLEEGEIKNELSHHHQAKQASTLTNENARVRVAVRCCS